MQRWLVPRLSWLVSAGRRSGPSMRPHWSLCRWVVNEHALSCSYCSSDQLLACCTSTLKLMLLPLVLLIHRSIMLCSVAAFAIGPVDHACHSPASSSRWGWGPHARVTAACTAVKCTFIGRFGCASQHVAVLHACIVLHATWWPVATCPVSRTRADCCVRS